MGPLPTKLFTTEQAGEYLIVPAKTVTRWIKEGKLKAYKIGGEWRISEEALEEFLTSGYTGKKPISDE